MTKSIKEKFKEFIKDKNINLTEDNINKMFNN